MKHYLLFASFLFLAFYSAIINAKMTFESPVTRVSLLELYTSEGCSSCPRADRYLSEFKDDKRLWKEFVPIAFHVDYWNYIGWPDRFSSHVYSDRQRNYARAKNISTVYTPGFLLNGEEWRSFFGLRRLSPDTSMEVGKLSIGVDKQQIEASYMPTTSKPGKLNLTIAVLGFGLVTDVQAGENRGKQLRHDFVVLGYKNVEMTASENGFEIATKLPKVKIGAPSMGIVAWVSKTGDQTPIQVVGGFLDKTN